VLTNGLLSTGTRLAANVAGAAPNSTYAAYTRLNVPTNLAGDVTGDPGLQFAQKFAGSMPGSEVAVKQASDNAVNAWQDALHATANKLGPAVTAQEAGSALQQGAKNWLQNFQNTSDSNWKSFHTIVPSTTPVEVPAFKSALADVLQDYGGADELAKVLQPGLARQLQGALNDEIAPPPAPAARVSGLLDSSGDPIRIEPSPQDMASYFQAVQGSGKLPWQAVAAVRTAIGEKIQSPMLISDTSQAALKRLYGGITQDMKSTAQNIDSNAVQAAGDLAYDGAINSGLDEEAAQEAKDQATQKAQDAPGALALFNNANNYTKTGHQFLADHLNGILQATNPEQATQFALAQARLGGSRLAALQSAMPQQFGNLAAYQMRALAGGEESPVSFNTALNGKRPAISPEAQSVMFGNPAVSQPFQDLQTVGHAMKETAKKANSSGTAAHETRGFGKLLTAIELSRQGREIAGTPGAVAGGALGFFAPNILGKAAQLTALNPMLSKFYSVPNPVTFSAPGLLARNVARALPANSGIPMGLLPAGLPVGVDAQGGQQ
jgi:hypothetical protein